MKSALTSMLERYLPHEVPQNTSDTIPSPPISETALFNQLTAIELHESKYKIISYGCSLNIRKDQIIWSRRLSRYGISHPQITSLETENWQPELSRLIQTRFVAEISRRLGVFPEHVDTTFLSRKLGMVIPKTDNAKDRPRRIDPRFANEERHLNEIRLATMPEIRGMRGLKGQVPPMEFNSEAIQKGKDYTVFVPSWGQYVRNAWLEEQSHRLTSSLQTIRPVTVPKQQLQQDSEDKENEMATEIESTSAQIKLEDANVEEKKVMALPSEIQSDTMQLGNSDKTDSAEITQQSVDTTASEPASSTPVTSVTVLSSQTEDGTTEDTDNTSKPTENLLEQTIEWSSADFVFVPRSVEQRRTIVSPLELQDDEYLGDTAHPEDTSSATER
jgi:hypothetical protein